MAVLPSPAQNGIVIRRYNQFRCLWVEGRLVTHCQSEHMADKYAVRVLLFWRLAIVASRLMTTVSRMDAVTSNSSTLWNLISNCQDKEKLLLTSEINVNHHPALQIVLNKTTRLSSQETGDKTTIKHV